MCACTGVERSRFLRGDDEEEGSIIVIVPLYTSAIYGRQCIVTRDNIILLCGLFRLCGITRHFTRQMIIIIIIIKHSNIICSNVLFGDLGRSKSRKGRPMVVAMVTRNTLNRFVINNSR